MIRAFALSTAFSLACATALASPTLDLTPIAKEVRSDGATRRLVFFRSGNVGLGRLSLVEYSPPWPITGSVRSASMAVPGKDACAELKIVETEEPLALEDESAVTTWVTKLMPEEAVGLRVASVKRDPVRLNGQPTIEVTLTYSLYGRSVQVGLLLSHRSAERPLELFIFEVTAHPMFFEQAHDTFQSSLYSIVGF